MWRSKPVMPDSYGFPNPAPHKYQRHITTLERSRCRGTGIRCSVGNDASYASTPLLAVCNNSDSPIHFPLADAVAPPDMSTQTNNLPSQHSKSHAVSPASL